MPISGKEFDSEEIILKQPPNPIKEYEWLISGEHYSKVKRQLKAVYVGFGLNWAGNFFSELFVWRNPQTKEQVQNTYDRNYQQETNKRVTVIAKIANTELLAKISRLIVPGIVGPDYQEQLDYLDKDFQGKLGNLKRDVDRGKMGAKIWYDLVEQDYKERREKLLVEMQNGT